MRFALLITALLAQSWAWAGYTGHSPYDVLHYDATIRPDLATKRVSGLVHIRFTSTQPNLSRLVLDANELEIESVKEGAASLEHEVDEGLLAISLAKPVSL